MGGEAGYEFHEVQCPTAAALLALQADAIGLVAQVETGTEERPLVERAQAQKVANELNTVAQLAGNAILGCLNCYGNGKLKGAACMPLTVSRHETLRAKYDVWRPKAQELLSRGSEG